MKIGFHLNFSVTCPAAFVLWMLQIMQRVEFFRNEWICGFWLVDVKTPLENNRIEITRITLVIAYT